MSRKKWDLAWHLALGITGVLLVSCAGSPSTPSHAPTPQPSRVELRVQFPTSHSSQSLTVLVTNGEAQPILAQDHQTDCTILLAEQHTDGQWRPLRNCAVMTPTRHHLLAPSQMLTVSLDVTAWPAGTYRITLAYALGQPRSPTRTTSSATFVLPLT